MNKRLPACWISASPDRPAKREKTEFPVDTRYELTKNEETAKPL